jgi:hypothetical protein
MFMCDRIYFYDTEVGVWGLQSAELLRSTIKDQVCFFCFYTITIANWPLTLTYSKGKGYRAFQSHGHGRYGECCCCGSLCVRCEVVVK